MDDFDVKLLQALGEDGRLTNNELGEAFRRRNARAVARRWKTPASSRAITQRCRPRRSGLRGMADARLLHLRIAFARSQGN
jgi:hypothetical protein